MQQRALDTSRKVKVRCVHGEVVDYPLVPVAIQFPGKTHRMEVAVNSDFKHLLILGTDWPAFTQLLGILCADASWETGRGQEEAVAQTGEALAEPSLSASEETRAREELKPPELDDFPLEQSRDETLKNAYDRVRSIDGQLLQPDQPLSFPYFSLIKERLYQVVSHGLVIDHFVTWYQDAFLELNASKTKDMVLILSAMSLTLKKTSINGQDIEVVTEYKYLGSIIDDTLCSSQIPVCFVKKASSFCIA